MTAIAPIPTATGYELYELYREYADLQPAIVSAARGILNDVSYDGFLKAKPDKLAVVQSLLIAVNEAWAGAHDVLAADAPRVVAELNRQRARAEAKRILEAEQADVTDDNWLTRYDLDDMPRGEPLIDGVIDRHTLVALSGRDQTYKSFMALDWCLSLANGQPWRGHQVDQCRVLLVVGEGAYGLRDRVAAWEQHHGYVDQILSSTFFVRCTPVNLFRGGADLDRLIERIDRHQIGLVVFDTLRRCTAGANLSLEADAGIVMSNLDRVRDATADGSAMFVAHTDKGDNDTRGSSVLEDDIDIVWRAKHDDESGAVRFRLAKRKDGPDGLSYTLTPRPVGPSLVLDDHLPALSAAVPKQVHPIVQLLRTPVFEDGASVSGLAQALGLSGYGSVTTALNWLIEHGKVAKAKSGRATIYTLKTGAEEHPPSAALRGSSPELPGDDIPQLPAQTRPSAELPPSFPDQVSSSAAPSVPIGTEAEGSRNGTDNTPPVCAKCGGEEHPPTLHRFEPMHAAT